MPELPEVESVRIGLQQWLLHEPTRIVSVRVLDPRILGTTSQRTVPSGAAEFFSARLVGAEPLSVERRGKFMWLPVRLADGDVTSALSVHLGMSGQFRVHTGSDALHPHTRAVFDVERASGEPFELRFVDQRIFGHLGVDALVPSYGYAVPSGAAHIALDPLDPAFDGEAVARALGRKRTGMKAALLDQTLVSGIGNIYADEALHAAGVHPLASTETTRISRVRRVLEAAREVMELSLSQGGTSFDALYVNVNGESGYFARSLQVYGRTGEPCRRCSTPIERLTVAGRSSHVCPRCQKRPRSRR